jgi:hypothetical protein
MLTRGLRWSELQRKMAGGEDRRRGWAVLAEEGDTEVAEPSGLRELVREAPAEVTRRLGQPETCRRRGN